MIYIKFFIKYIQYIFSNKIVARNKEHLLYLIAKDLKSKGNNCDLNHIDTSLITDMSQLFSHSLFNGNISAWNVSNVKDMSWMFSHSQFNGDISQWNTSYVRTISGMFSYSQFNEDISQWNTSHVRDMSWVFEMSIFNQDISAWDVSHVEKISHMFLGSQFNQDLNGWTPTNVFYELTSTFEACSSPIPYWYSEFPSKVRALLEKKTDLYHLKKI